jgi:hypothetical protein
MNNIYNDHQLEFLKSLAYLSDSQLKLILENESGSAMMLLSDDDYDTLWDIE